MMRIVAEDAVDNPLLIGNRHAVSAIVDPLHQIIPVIIDIFPAVNAFPIESALPQGIQEIGFHDPALFIPDILKTINTVILGQPAGAVSAEEELGHISRLIDVISESGDIAAGGPVDIRQKHRRIVPKASTDVKRFTGIVGIPQIRSGNRIAGILQDKIGISQFILISNRAQSVIGVSEQISRGTVPIKHISAMVDPIAVGIFILQRLDFMPAGRHHIVTLHLPAVRC